MGKHVNFGDDLPVVKAEMVYVGRAQCGHVQWIVPDDLGAADKTLDRVGVGEVIERITLGEARDGEGTCDRCHIEQPGLGL